MKQVIQQKKVLMVLLLALAVCVGVLAGCSDGVPASSAEPESVAEPEPAPLESEPAPEAPGKVLLAISFGTSFNDNRDLSIGGVETALANAYPDYELRRAFTSQIIIDVLKERDNLEIDNVTQAMDKLVADGVKELLIQPTHVMNGFEYDDVVAEIKPYADKFDSIKFGKQLLFSDADYEAVVAAIAEGTKEYDVEGTAIVFMGHGTEHEANAAYAKLGQAMHDAGHANYFIGTVEGAPLIEDVIADIQATGAKKVVLLPFMIVAGDHANNDMAGDEAESWKSILAAAGFEVETVIKGLGEYPEIQELFVKHAGEAPEFH